MQSATFGCFPEYWATGRPRLEADVAACGGLLAGGADELVVMDRHGGNRINVRAESLSPGARLETSKAVDLRSHGVDAMCQVGYHARRGVDGLAPYGPSWLGTPRMLPQPIRSGSRWRRRSSMCGAQVPAAVVQRGRRSAAARFNRQ